MLSSIQFNPSPPRMNPSEVVTQESLTSHGHCYCCSTSVKKNPVLSVVGKQINCSNVTYSIHSIHKSFTFQYIHFISHKTRFLFHVFNISSLFYRSFYLSTSCLSLSHPPSPCVQCYPILCIYFFSLLTSSSSILLSSNFRKCTKHLYHLNPHPQSSFNVTPKDTIFLSM